ncbi:MAG: ABC transporter permease [Emergencia sp.]
MQIPKYAWRNIMRTKGRSTLIGIIVIIISFALCISLCIRQSAADSKDDALSKLTITAQISPDRGAAMEKAQGGEPGSFDKSKLKEAMNAGLTLEEMQTYAAAESVQDFYYTLSVSADAAGDLEAYSTSSDGESGADDESGSAGLPDYKSMGKGMGMNSGDFTVTGYSSDTAMTEFVDGSCTITSGQMFEENTTEKVCVISDELAAYNNLEVGDRIKLASTENEDSTVTLKITGIYNNSQASAQASSMGGGMGFGKMGGFTDPANCIYTSYAALSTITEDSDDFSGSLNGTYVLGTVEAYEAFQNEVADLGLPEGYTVSSSDISQYEQSAQPLENLAKFAGYFLIVVLVIGALILIIMNIFATRERKYEIGVLAAIGMKKRKVAQLFLTEILIITLACTVIGGGVGAAVSVPVTNTLLESQIDSQQSDMGAAFGRDFNQKPSSAPAAETPSEVNSADNQGEETGKAMPSADVRGGQMRQYISEVSNAVNPKVLIELLLSCVLLALLSGMVSVIAILRYEPLEILSNRD